jgi:uroporphyrinogen-III decarboxylase
MAKEMTSRERLWAVLSHQEPDRVPIWMLYPRLYLPYYADVHHLPDYAEVMPYVWEKTDWLDRRGIPIPPFYTAAARVEEKNLSEGDWLITKSVLFTPKGSLTAEFRAEKGTASSSTTEYYCKDLSDLDKILAIPYEPAEPDASSFLNAAKELGDAGLMMVDLGMTVGITYELMGPEAFAIYSIAELDTLYQFSRVMFERLYVLLEKLLKAGVGPVFFPVDSEYVSPPLVSPRTFDALVAPFYAPLFELIHEYGGKVIVHHHGKINRILERLVDLGVDGIHPIEEPPVGDCSLANAKRRVGQRTCLVGSVQWDDFQRLPPDEMEALVKRQISDAAQGGGMILAPSAGPYPDFLSERHQENTIRFIEAGLRWGRYPLQV